MLRGQKRVAAGSKESQQPVLPFMERRLLPQSVTKTPFLLNEIYDLGHYYATHNLGLWQSNFLFQFGEQSSSEESRGRQGPNCGKSVLVHRERQLQQVTSWQVAPLRLGTPAQLFHAIMHCEQLGENTPRWKNFTLFFTLFEEARDDTLCSSVS